MDDSIDENDQVWPQEYLSKTHDSYLLCNPQGVKKLVQIPVFHNFLEKNTFFQKVLSDIKNWKLNFLLKRFLSVFIYLEALQS